MRHFIISLIASALAIAGHRASEASEGKTVGMFGLGVLSAFMVADAIVVVTRSEADSTGWKLTWARKTATEFKLEAVDRARRGTEARLYLSSEPSRDFRGMASERKLQDYIARTFALLPIPVRVGKDPLPVDVHHAWLAEDLEEGAERVAAADLPLELVAEQTDPQVPVSAVYVGHTVGGARVFLGMPFEANETFNEHNVGVFRRGVRVEKKPRKFWPEHLAFLVGLVDFPGLQIRLDREGYLEEDKAFRDFQAYAAVCGMRFLELLAEKDPDLLTRSLRTHGKMLIPHAAQDPRLLALLKRHYAFETLGGGDCRWEKLVASAREDQKNPAGPPVLYTWFADSLVTRYDVERVLGRGIEVSLARPGVRILLERLGMSAGVRIANIEELFDEPADVSDAFRALRARLTPFLIDKGIYRVEFFKATDDALTPANFKIERTAPRRDRKSSAAGQDAQPMMAVSALRLNVGHPFIICLAERVGQVNARMIGRAAELLFSVAALKSPFEEIIHRVTSPVVEVLIEGVMRDLKNPFVSTQEELGKCFVALPYRDHFSVVWEVANEVLSKSPYGWKVIRADEDLHGVGLLDGVMDHIASSQRFIADVSGLNQNVLLELGMMLQKHKPGVLILTDYETHQEMPADLKGEVCARYDKAWRSDRAKMREWLEKEVQRRNFFNGMPGKDTPR